MQEEEYEESDFQFFMTAQTVDDNKNEPNLVFKSQLYKETKQNLRKWLVLDSASTTHLGCNRRLMNKYMR